MIEDFKKIIPTINKLTGKKYPQLELAVQKAMDNADIPLLTDLSKLVDDLENTILFGEETLKLSSKDMMYKEITLKFQDLKNLDHLIVIHESGVPLFNYSFAEKFFDPDLLSGFLTAIDSFQDTSMIKNNSDHTGFELSYANFQILLNSGKNIKVALIMDSKPSKSAKISLLDFINSFEIRYEKELKEFNGSLKPFQEAEADLMTIVDESFKSSLMWPHRVKLEIKNNIKNVQKNLNNLQNMILDSALDLESETEYFLLSRLTQRLQDSRNALEKIIETFYELKEKDLFICFPMEKMDLILEKEKEKESIHEISSSLDDDEIIVPINGISKKLTDKVNEHLRDTSYLFQKIIIEEFIKAKKEKSNFLKDKYNNWNDLKKQKLKIVGKIGQMVEKNNYYELASHLIESKNICEELGYEEKADQIAEEIFDAITILKQKENDKYTKLVDSFNKSLNKYIEKAENEIINQNFLQGAYLYKKSIRIAKQLGNKKMVKSLKKVLSDIEN